MKLFLCLIILTLLPGCAFIEGMHEFDALAAKRRPPLTLANIEKGTKTK